MPAPAPPLDSLTPGLDSPAFDGADVTPNDTSNLAVPARALWVGVGGDVRLRTLKGATIELRNVPSGSLLPICATRVFATGHTGTAASAIVALY
jgi:hypothetical protein